jgi:hypothetical protein
LAILSIFFGYITKDIFIGFGSSFFADNSLFFHPSHEIFLDTEFAVPSLFKLLPLFFTISISAISIVFSEFFPRFLVYFKFSSFGYNIFSFFNQRFLIELFYNRYITSFILSLASQTTKILDKGSVELIGPFGLEKGLLTLSKNIASLDTGIITSYALYILVGLLVYILIPYLSLNYYYLLLFIVFALLTMINNDIKSPPKPNKYTDTPIIKVKDIVTIIIGGLIFTIPKDCLSIVSNFGIGFLLGLPLVENLIVFFNSDNLPYFLDSATNAINLLPRYVESIINVLEEGDIYVRHVNGQIQLVTETGTNIEEIENILDADSRTVVMNGLHTFFIDMENIRRYMTNAEGLLQGADETNPNLQQLRELREELARIIEPIVRRIIRINNRD